MGNCFVTKLKSSVDNSNLEKLGEFKLGVSGSRNFYARATTPIELQISDDYPAVTFMNGERTMTLGTSTSTVNTSAACDIIVKDKYKLQMIEADGTVNCKCNFDSLQYNALSSVKMYSGINGSDGEIVGHTSRFCNTLTELTLISKGIIVDGLPTMPNLTSFYIVASKAIDINEIASKCPVIESIMDFYACIKGSIDTLTAKTSVTTLRFEQRGASPSSITGDIVHLGTWKGLTILNLSGATSISGTLESFCNAQVTAGRTSGSIAFTGNGVVTYNGTAIAKGASKTITFSGGSYTVA